MATGETVTVALKHPSGLRLDVMGPEEVLVANTPAGPVKEARRARLKSIYVRGSADERRLDTANDRGRPIDHAGVAHVRGGYGLTHNVPKDFWDEWVRQNSDYPLVKNGLIFASSRGADGKAAEQGTDLKGSFEPLDPNGITIGNIKFEPAYGKEAA